MGDPVGLCFGAQGEAESGSTRVRRQHIALRRRDPGQQHLLQARVVVEVLDMLGAGAAAAAFLRRR